MDRLINLFSEWEIKLLVLLSFALQLFLFFAGRLRRGNSNRFLRLCLWAAYLGADVAAVYALGYLSHRQDVTIERNIVTRIQPLAFFWAPFLLIHLGGQDTITAFAMEDNNLWLRHLLNLVTQVALALYVFWKSIGKHSANILLAGSFVFVAGIIKYGERTWSLKCGSLKSLESSDDHIYRKELPERSSGDVGLVQAALDSMPYVIGILSERTVLDEDADEVPMNDLHPTIIADPDQLSQVGMLQLGMIYDDLYTKSLVLRTCSGVILRCISQAAVIVAFVLFHVCDKERYSKVDTAITYSLFVGFLCLEVCSIIVSMMSPWTWAWLQVQEWDTLAKLSWFVFRCDIGYPRIKQRWPNLIGQYNFHNWLTDSNPQQRTYSQRIMILFRKLFVDLFGVQKRNLFFMSKLLDTEYMDLDNMILKRVAEEVRLLVSEGHSDKPEEWLKIGSILTNVQRIFVKDMGCTIILMHLLTEANLKNTASHSDIEANSTKADVPVGLMEVCRKLSNYMMYLLVTQPSMLPLSISAAANLNQVQGPEPIDTDDVPELEASKETLEEIARMWTRLLLYAAGKSRAALHVAQLSGGGELITFAWLLMAHSRIGEFQNKKLELTTNEAHAEGVADITKLYAFCLPSKDQKSGTDNRSESDDE